MQVREFLLNKEGNLWYAEVPNSCSSIPIGVRTKQRDNDFVLDIYIRLLDYGLEWCKNDVSKQCYYLAKVDESIPDSVYLSNAGPIPVTSLYGEECYLYKALYDRKG